jgi:hypothetical protein
MSNSPVQPLRINDSRPGPKTPEGRKRALANLRPWQKGQSGNPKGRPTYGLVAREWANIMADMNKAELLAIIDDDEAPSAKVAAAQQVMKARNGDGQAFDRIADRTEGRPPQALTVKAVTADTRSLEERARHVLDALRRGQVPEAEDVPRVEYADDEALDPLESRE